MRRTLATMLDLSLLKSPSFMLLAFSGFFCMLGFFAPFIFLKERALNGGMDAATASYLVSAIGLASTVARILCGYLSTLESVDALLLSNFAITVGGVMTIVSGVSFHPAYQFTFTCVFGLATGTFCPFFSFDLLFLTNRFISFEIS